MNLIQRRIMLIGVAATFCMVLGACQRKQTAEIWPITPSFEVNKARAPIGSPIEVTYRFEIAAESKPIPGDYRVFVHFVDSHDELLFTDDHTPLEPTSSWQPGSTVEYTRTVFIPLYPYLGTATVEMGLYDPDTEERLGLLGTDNGQLGYRVGQIDLQDQKENIFLVYKEGWHQLESSPENPSIEWQWTKKEAVCSFKNPKVDSMVYLHADTNVKAFDTPLEVGIRIGDTELTRFQITDRNPILKKIPIPASALGPEDWVDLRIVTDKSFIPADDGIGVDTRELALRVYHLYIGAQPGT
ncbi:MAG: hypothetical protein ACE5JI_18945 [Acidobacteriota bacterium]